MASRTFHYKNKKSTKTDYNYSNQIEEKSIDNLF